MRVFIAAIILIFSFQSLVKADDIRDFKIEGFSIFDNLLDNADKLNLTKEEILSKKIKYYPKSKRIGLLRFKNRGAFKVYDSVQFSVDTKSYKIYTISGIIENINSKEECTKKQKEIIKSLHEMAPSAEKVVEDYSVHLADPSGKSIASGIYLDFISGDTLSAECYIWSKIFKDKGYDDNLKINIESKEGRLFLQNEAYP